MSELKAFEKARQELERNGAFSEVKRAINKATGEAVAIKIIDRKKCSGKENMIQSEINILKKVRHSHIVQLYELFETELKIYLVMELVTGGELFDSIVARGHYTETDAARIVQKILEAVDYLHNMGIAHRDLKPENLLFYDENGVDSKIMLSDFGLSKIFNDEEMMKTACGTPGYVAPEVLKRQGYGKEVDIWSMGVITYILLCGYPPFYDENNQELFQQIMRGEFEFDSPHWDDISTEAKDLISKMLVVDPKKRLTTTGALRHPFLVMHCPVVAATPQECKVETSEAETTVAFPLAFPKASPPTAPIPEKNLAHRISENMRARGMSGSRRRSVDQKRVSPYVPSHAPPVPKVARVEEDEPAIPVYGVSRVQQNELVPTPLPLPPKEKPDSALGSRSLESSNDKVNKAQKDEEPNEEFLQNVMKLNNMLASNEVMAAHAFLETFDCPSKLRDLYERIIFDNPEFKKQQTRAIANSKESLAKADDTSEASKFLHTMLETISLKRIPSPSPSSGATEKYRSQELAPSKQQHVKDISQVRMLSLDINLRPPGIKTNHSDFKDARLEYFCSHILPKYDVVCLQECFAFGSRRREKLLERASQLGYKSWVCSPGKVFFDGAADSPLGIDGGLVLLSRYSIVRSARMAFERGVFADRLVAKGAIYAAISVPTVFGNQLIHIFNTDLQSSYEPLCYVHHDPTEPTCVTRRHQIAELKKFVDQQLEHDLSFYPEQQVSATGKHHDSIFVVGNFHVNARREAKDGVKHGDEYMIMKKILEAPSASASTAANAVNWITAYNDVLYDGLGEHPITYGDVRDFILKTPMETVLTNKKFASICASTNFVFELNVLNCHDTPAQQQQNDIIVEKVLKYKKDSAQVEKFPVSATSDQILDSMEMGSAAFVPESKQVEFSATSLEASKSSVSPEFALRTASKQDRYREISQTLESFKSALDMQSNGASVNPNPKKLQSSISEESLASEISVGSGKKGGGVRELIDAKVGAMAAYFSLSSSTSSSVATPQKIKFTQISATPVREEANAAIKLSSSRIPSFPNFSTANLNVGTCTNPPTVDANVFPIDFEAVDDEVEDFEPRKLRISPLSRSPFGPDAKRDRWRKSRHFLLDMNSNEKKNHMPYHTYDHKFNTKIKKDPAIERWIFQRYFGQFGHFKVNGYAMRWLFILYGVVPGFIFFGNEYCTAKFDQYKVEDINKGRIGRATVEAFINRTSS